MSLDTADRGYVSEEGLDLSTTDVTNRGSDDDDQSMPVADRP